MAPMSHMMPRIRHALITSGSDELRRAMMRLRAVVCAARGCSGGQHACHTASSVKHGVLCWLPPIMCGARGARRGAVREARCRARGESVTAPRSRRCMHLMHPMRHVRQTMTSAQGKAAAQPGTCCNGRQHHRVLTVPHCQQPAKSRCRSCSKSSPPRGAPQTHRPSSASPCATLPTRAEKRYTHQPLGIKHLSQNFNSPARAGAGRAGQTCR